MLPSSSLPGFSGSRNVLSPNDFSSASVLRVPFGIPPVDQADAVEVAVGPLLQVGDVLVVDAEHPLAQRLVRVVEQRQHGVGEGQFLVDAVLVELADARLDVVGRGTGEVVVLHEHAAEVAAGPGLALHADHVGAVLVPDARRGALEVLGEAFVEDVVGHRDVVVGREDLGAGGQPDDGRRRRGRAGSWARPSLRADRERWHDAVGVDIVGTPIGLWAGCCGGYQVTGSS